MNTKSTFKLVSALCTTALVASGVTYALFAAQTSPAVHLLTTGSVTLGQPQTDWVDVSGLLPGQSDTRTFSVQYTGDADAWLGVIPQVSGQLVSCDGGKFIIRLDNAAGQGIVYNWNQPVPQVIRSGGTVDNPVASPVSKGTVETFNLYYELPIDTGDDCQTKSASIQLQVVAVQAKLNTNTTNNGPASWGSPTVAPQPAAAAVDQAYAPSSYTDDATLDNTFIQMFTAGRTGSLEKLSLGLSRIPGTSAGPVVIQVRRLIDGTSFGETALLAVRFVQLWNGFNGGEVAGFPPSKARDLVEQLKVAVYWHPPLSPIDHQPSGGTTADSLGPLLGQGTVDGTALPEVRGRLTDAVFSTPLPIVAGEVYAIVIPGDLRNEYVLWQANDGNPYAGGHAASAGVYGSGWYHYNNDYDLHFMTFVR